jgi:hypothetical protein
MSDTLVVDGKYYLMSNDILIASKTDTETSNPVTIHAHTQYTLLCSTLGSGEEILGEIYDPTKTAWQPWYFAGNRIKLAQNQEQFFFDGVSAIVRFVKPATTAQVGLTLFYA